MINSHWGKGSFRSSRSIDKLFENPDATWFYRLVFRLFFGNSFYGYLVRRGEIDNLYCRLLKIREDTLITTWNGRIKILRKLNNRRGLLEENMENSEKPSLAEQYIFYYFLMNTLNFDYYEPKEIPTQIYSLVKIAGTIEKDLDEDASIVYVSLIVSSLISSFVTLFENFPYISGPKEVLEVFKGLAEKMSALDLVVHNKQIYRYTLRDTLKSIFGEEILVSMYKSLKLFDLENEIIVARGCLDGLGELSYNSLAVIYGDYDEEIEL